MEKAYKDGNVWIINQYKLGANTCIGIESANGLRLDVKLLSTMETIASGNYTDYVDDSDVPYTKESLNTFFQDFFFRVNGISQADADDRYFNESDAVESYTADEIDALHNISLQSKIRNDVFEVSGIDYEFPIGAYSLNATSTTMVDGMRYYVTYNVKKTRNITGVTFNMATAQASFTGDNENVIVLYYVNKATGDLTELTRTANDPNIWKGLTNAKITIPFLVAQNNVAPGIYAVGLLYNCSGTAATSPTLATCGIAYSSFYLFANNFRITGQTAAQTTMPSSVNMSTWSIGSTVAAMLIY